MRLGIPFLLLFSCAVQGQVAPNLIEYLSLSREQVSKLSANIREYSTWLDGKQERIASLRVEIAAETARDTPGPAELGWRYAEIAVTCRALFGEQRQLQARNVALLNEAQKAKLKALQDALRLYPIIVQAQSASLLQGGGTNADFSAILDPAAAIFTPPITACASGFPQYRREDSPLKPVIGGPR
ncbi:MAG: hypothetical protein IT166_03405 [Bryobacterales bacterium]|nr:hypothetical protein [Bryobacterales bacterium]